MTRKQIIPAAWQEGHDHSDCVARAVSAAEEICKKKGARLTQLRQRVLELVWRSHKPVRAYALLDEISKENKSAAPPTVYRALDFLMEQGLVHRIQSLNAYVGCTTPGHAHKGVFLICNDCGEALEIADGSVAKSINRFANDLGFQLSTHWVEAAGSCPGCQA